jgi:hypothetical protein
MSHTLPCLSRASRDYAVIWGACAKAGGLSPMRDVMRRVPDACACDLMHRVNAGGMLVFPLHHVLWMPNFQFDGSGLLLSGVEEAIGALRCYMDLAEITLWFCSPNEYLDGVAPMGELARRPEAIVEAAWASRQRGER